MSELTRQDLETLLAIQLSQIRAMKKYIEALEYCSDEAEVYHRLRESAMDMKQLKKEAGL